VKVSQLRTEELLGLLRGGYPALTQQVYHHRSGGKTLSQWTKVSFVRSVGMYVQRVCVPFFGHLYVFFYLSQSNSSPVGRYVVPTAFVLDRGERGEWNFGKSMRSAFAGYLHPKDTEIPSRQQINKEI
jgi:hypothetical protein